jgi:hypothetical protein
MVCTMTSNTTYPPASQSLSPVRTISHAGNKMAGIGALPA